MLSSDDIKNDELRERSGYVSFDSKLTSFLYELMRDYLPAGTIEEIIRSSESNGKTIYSNGWLAKYADDLAKRLETQK